ncbi:hypothetical protein V2J09_005838 [Rumex salicifolius]
MAKSWLTDGRNIARKVMGGSCSRKQIRDCDAKLECPKCHHWIDNSDVSYEWPGFPMGVKFDPSDAELLDHLAARCGSTNAVPHMFIDDFIPTLTENRGICYTHPENLPGAKKDGSCIHFFHKTANAYSSGPRKRRKIQSNQTESKVRWHKTGKTKPVFDSSGVQKGCKKIMVLYRCTKKGGKPVKSNWVMHQYHLGMEEDEKEDEYVVSKILYQQQKGTEKEDKSITAHEEPLDVMNPIGPNTPTPNPPRPGTSSLYDDSTYQDLKPINEASGLLYNLQHEEELKYNPNTAGESQTANQNPVDFEDPLLCNELLESCTSLTDGCAKGINHVTDGNLGGSYGLSELENLDFDTPPDISLADLQFCSQDSITKWFDNC